MKFDCKKIFITHNDRQPNVFLQETKASWEDDMNFYDYQKAIGKYVILQIRPDSENENISHPYIETSDASLRDFLVKFHIRLSKSYLLIMTPKAEIEVKLNLRKKKYNKLKETLLIIFKNHGELSIRD